MNEQQQHALLNFYYAVIALSAKQKVERSDLIAEIGKCRSILEKYDGRQQERR